MKISDSTIGPSPTEYRMALKHRVFKYLEQGWPHADFAGDAACLAVPTQSGSERGSQCHTQLSTRLGTAPRLTRNAPLSSGSARTCPGREWLAPSRLSPRVDAMFILFLRSCSTSQSAVRGADSSRLPPIPPVLTVRCPQLRRGCSSRPRESTRARCLSGERRGAVGSVRGSARR